MKTKLLLSITTVTILLFSCKKNDTGGKATIAAYVKHHEQPINFPTVYVKFGATDMPSDPTNNYDLKIIGKHENHVHIEDLRYGKYYLYAEGYDSSISQTVKGGIAVKIKWKDRKDEIDIDIPVTED